MGPIQMEELELDLTAEVAAAAAERYRLHSTCMGTCEGGWGGDGNHGNSLS